MDGSGGPFVVLDRTDGAIDEFVFSPDRSRIAYRFDFTFTTDSLWSVLTNGSGSTVQLSRLPSQRRFTQFEISPDSTRVVYRADQDTLGRAELYSVPIGGSALPVKLNSTLAANADVEQGYGFSPDGTRYVYRVTTNLSTGPAHDLFSAPISGAAGPTLLNGTSSTSDGPYSVELSPLGRVIYANQIPPYALSSVPVDGSASPLVLDSLGNCLDFQLTPDGTRVVYTRNCQELDSRRADGSAGPVRIDAGSGNVKGFALTPDSRGAVYRKNQLDPNVIELFGTPLDGSAAPLYLNEPFPFNRYTGVVSAFATGSARAAYLVSEEGQKWRLFGVNTLGDAVQVNLGLHLRVTNSIAPQVTPDGTHVLFGVDGYLYAAPLDGTSAAVMISKNQSTFAWVMSFRFSPDGRQVAYLLVKSSTVELFHAPTDGSAVPRSLSKALVSGGAVQDDFQFTPDGTRVIYRADQEVDERYELYSADGLAPAIKLNAALPLGADIAFFQLTHDGSRAVFPGNGSPYQLVSAPVDGSAGQIPIALPSTAIQRVQVSPVADVVVYATHDGIYRTSTSAVSPLLLVPFPSINTDLRDLQFTPDGQRVVYVTNELNNVFRYDLFSVPVDGSAPSVELSLVKAGGGVTQFRITSDGARVVYRADQGVYGRFDLFSVPVDTRAGMVKLDGLLPPFGDVEDFQLGPDGSFVAYRADADVDGVLELFAVPVTARHPAVKLHRSITIGGVQPDYTFTPDSRQVLFRIDKVAPLAYELHASFVPGRERPEPTPPH